MCPSEQADTTSVSAAVNSANLVPIRRRRSVSPVAARPGSCSHPAPIAFVSETRVPRTQPPEPIMCDFAPVTVCPHDHHVECVPPVPLEGRPPPRPGTSPVPDRRLTALGAAQQGLHTLVPGALLPAGQVPMANPHVVLRGMVFLGKDVEIHATPEMSRMEIGRWVHIGDGNSIRCHEGNLRIGDKAVFGCNNVVNAYPTSSSGVVAGRRLVLHLRLRPRHRRHQHPDQDQGIVKSPVRIGPDTWVATKVTVLHNTIVGRGCVPVHTPSSGA